MGLFKKKDKADNSTPPQPQAKAVGKKPQKETMSSVLRESVVEAVLENLRQNTSCITQTEDGELVYAGLHLHVDDIGGLSKKSRKDEAKGQIIESINNNRIKVMITADMLESEDIIFIPDVMTLDAMDEFTILRTAPYKLALINDSGDVTFTDYVITFDAVKHMAETGAHIDTVLADIGVDYGDSDDYDDIDTGEPLYDDDDDDDFFVNHKPAPQPAPAPDDDNEDSLPFGSDDDDSTPFGDDEPADDILDEIPEEVPDEDDFVEDDSDEVPDEDAPEDTAEIASIDDEIDEDEDDGDVEIPEDTVNDTIIRRFYSDDLGLEVSTEPFDIQFKSMNTFIPFDENRGEGWLNQFLNERAANANVQLKRLHNANLAMARDAYMRMVAKACDDIQRELDYDAPDTRYSEIMVGLSQQKAVMYKNAEDEIKKKKTDLNADYEAKLQKAQDDAAASARQQFNMRFGRQHDSDIAAIESSVRNNIEEQYQQAKRDVNDKRRNEAQARLDCAITAILKSVSTMYSRCLDEEKALYERLAKENTEFLDRHLKDDIARSDALAAEIKHSTEVQRTIAECKSKIESMSSEFDAKRMSLEAEIEQMKRDTQAMLVKKDNECAERVQNAKEDVEAKQAEIDKLVEQYANLSKQKENEYGSRINELKNQCTSWEEHCDHVERTHKRVSSILVAFMIVATCAAIAVGTLIGLNMNINDNIRDVYQKNQTSYSQQVTEESTTQAQPETTQSQSETTQQYLEQMQ